MLETVVTSQGNVSIHATVRRVGVYLDNYSIISLARGPGEQRMDTVEPGFFRLGSVLDWLIPHRATIRRKLSELDQVLGDRLLRLRHAYEQDRQRFEQVLPEPRYEDSRPATSDSTASFVALRSRQRPIGSRRAMVLTFAIPLLGLRLALSQHWTSTGSGASTFCRSRIDWRESTTSPSLSSL